MKKSIFKYCAILIMSAICLTGCGSADFGSASDSSPVSTESTVSETVVSETVVSEDNAGSSEEVEVPVEEITEPVEEKVYRIKSKSSMYDENTVYDLCEYIYDANGYLVDSGNKTYENDANGNHLVVTSYLDSTKSYKMYVEEYTYDENGNILTYDPYGVDWEGNLVKQEFEKRVYDSDNRLIERHSFWGDSVVDKGSPLFDYYYNYDENGLLVSIDCSGESTVFEYDENGLLLTEGYIDYEGTYSVTLEYTYNSLGLLETETEYTYWEPNVPTVYCTTSYTYDENGNIDTETHKYEEGYTEIYKFEWELAE